ncbi:hypothetical protein HYDPIDRAFT_107227 [Hydnomerulius pinastri MD-312]|nr:hypothetical protein HYDPIDRAFT_107227 [Hydnomerulius pinastri MD-312]
MRIATHAIRAMGPAGRYCCRGSAQQPAPQPHEQLGVQAWLYTPFNGTSTTPAVLWFFSHCGASYPYPVSVCLQKVDVTIEQVSKRHAKELIRVCDESGGDHSTGLAS